MEIRDLWPETIAAVGAMNKGRVYKALERLELRLYKSATKLIVVTDTFKKKITARGITPNKIFVHKNGVILEKFKPGPKDLGLLQAMPELEGKFVFAYIGTHGMTHGLDFVINAIKQLENSNPEIHFLFIGEGAEKQNLVELSDKLKLSNITFHPLVSKDVVSKYLSLMDVSLVNLRKSDTFKTVIPSKIFEAAALQKPILLGLEGESKEIIQSYNAGLCFEPENESEFIEQCKTMLDIQHYQEFQKGCEKLALDFDRKQIALQVLETITTY
jgi:glycosyltransferase involved in cell wall biosynthesis